MQNYIRWMRIEVEKLTQVELFQLDVIRRRYKWLSGGVSIAWKWKTMQNREMHCKSAWSRPWAWHLTPLGVISGRVDNGPLQISAVDHTLDGFMRNLSCWMRFGVKKLMQVKSFHLEVIRMRCNQLSGRVSMGEKCKTWTNGLQPWEIDFSLYKMDTSRFSSHFYALPFTLAMEEKREEGGFG